MSDLVWGSYLVEFFSRIAHRPGVMDRFNSEVQQISCDIFNLCHHEGFTFVDAMQEQDTSI